MPSQGHNELTGRCTANNQKPYHNILVIKLWFSLRNNVCCPTHPRPYFAIWYSPTLSLFISRLVIIKNAQFLWQFTANWTRIRTLSGWRQFHTLVHWHQLIHLPYTNVTLVFWKLNKYIAIKIGSQNNGLKDLVHQNCKHIPRNWN